MSVLSVRQLQKNYGRTEVLHGVSFDLDAGEILGFIGPNGAGKSTTMKCIAGLERYQGGTIEIKGYDLERERNAALAHIGLSIESPGLYPQLTGLEHLRYFGKLRQLPESRIQEMVAFTKLGKSIKRRCGTYSMGMKQRLALALALLTEPELLLLDEPTNGLDPGAVANLREEIQALRDRGVAILYSSHQLGELERICDRTIFIREGEIIDLEDMTEMQWRSYTFYFADCEAALKDLKSDFPEVAVAPSEDGGLELRIPSEEIFSKILNALIAQGHSILSIRENAISLEDRYADLYAQ